MKRLLLALGLVALTGSAFAQNWSKELEKAAKGGDVEAQVQVGHAYLKGEGVKKNTKKATQYLSKATLQGSEEAKDLLYSFYNNELIKKAWMEGDAEAQYRLGLCLLEGAEVAQDTELAAGWMEKSMEQGYEEARAKFYSFDSEVRRRRVKEVSIQNMHCPALYTGEVVEENGEPSYPANGPCSIKTVNYGGMEFSGTWEDGILKNAVFKTGTLELHGDIVFGNMGSIPTFNNVLSRVLWTPTLLKGGKIVIKGEKAIVGDSIVIKNTPYCWKAPLAFDTRSSLRGSWLENKQVIGETDNNGNAVYEWEYVEPNSIILESDLKLGAKLFDLPDNRLKATTHSDSHHDRRRVIDLVNKVNDGREVNAKLRFYMDDYMQIHWLRCYDFTCQNGARVVKNMDNVDFAYYPADGSEPSSLAKGTATSVNGVTVSWEYLKDCTDGRPWQLEVTDRNGDVINVRGDYCPLNAGMIMDILSGYYYLFTSEKKLAQVDIPFTRDGRVINHHSVGNSQGTYTYTDGRVESIIDGRSETEIREEKERIKREEEAKRKAEEEAKKVYEAKCRKYGKAYVDAAAEGKLKVGMHLDLVKEIYGERYLQRGREYSDGTSWYYVETMAGTIRVSVWLKNDRVTDFSLR